MWGMPGIARGRSPAAKPFLGLEVKLASEAGVHAKTQPVVQVLTSLAEVEVALKPRAAASHHPTGGICRLPMSACWAGNAVLVLRQGTGRVMADEEGQLPLGLQN